MGKGYKVDLAGIYVEGLACFLSIVVFAIVLIISFAWLSVSNSFNVHNNSNLLNVVDNTSDSLNIGNSGNFYF